MNEALARARALHQPRNDGPLSLVSWTYCSCGATEFCMIGGERSIGPARYPCETARLLDEAIANE